MKKGRSGDPEAMAPIPTQTNKLRNQDRTQYKSQMIVGYIPPQNIPVGYLPKTSPDSFSRLTRLVIHGADSKSG